ncbi:hypothetical protein EYF80_014126 [Liparis tanakae]|uniref:Uncharacterized protein n=1 Tax=Liparis tanakae TaxID=230148 RepID=A0A4Z2IF99_9TELE|nr:hypothetical protein EYF80_014126 [Liparis tanakae]
MQFALIPGTGLAPDPDLDCGLQTVQTTEQVARKQDSERPRSKDMQLTIVQNKEKQEILRLEKMEQASV